MFSLPILSKGIGYVFMMGIVYGIFSGVFFAINYREGVGWHMLLNIPGMLLGDYIQSMALQIIGDPHSDHAFFTIPWILRQPTVYVVASVLFWGGLGYGLQYFISSVRDKPIPN